MLMPAAHRGKTIPTNKVDKEVFLMKKQSEA
jgi:hypothetical protein